jgi:hypothetical protein
MNAPSTHTTKRFHLSISAPASFLLPPWAAFSRLALVIGGAAVCGRSAKLKKLMRLILETVRWLRLDGHECCLNNEQHYYEKERIQFISSAGQTRPTQI